MCVLGVRVLFDGGWVKLVSLLLWLFGSVGGFRSKKFVIPCHPSQSFIKVPALKDCSYTFQIPDCC